MLACVLRVLLGLGRVLLALGMVVLAMRFGGGAMRLCRGLVMFRRLVVFVFHVGFLILADEFRQWTRAASIVAKERALVVLIERTETTNAATANKAWTRTCVLVSASQIRNVASSGLPGSCPQNSDMPKSPFTHGQRWCYRRAQIQISF